MRVHNKYSNEMILIIVTIVLSSFSSSLLHFSLVLLALQLIQKLAGLLLSLSIPIIT